MKKITTYDKATIKRIRNAFACDIHYCRRGFEAHSYAFIRILGMGTSTPCDTCVLSIIEAARAKPAKRRARRKR